MWLRRPKAKSYAIRSFISNVDKSNVSIDVSAFWAFLGF